VGLEVTVKKNLWISIRMTLVTTALLGLGYPLAVTGLAQFLFPTRANGQLIEREGELVGSHIIGQPFSSPRYFHPRPSAAGIGYDPLSSGGSNLAPTNHLLVDRVADAVKELEKENSGEPVPVDLVTTSGSGLDPDITPAAAEFQVRRVARARGISEADVRRLVAAHTRQRDFGVLGEPRVNVLELNLDLDFTYPHR